jgi:hypothetical protein
LFLDNPILNERQFLTLPFNYLPTTNREEPFLAVT